MTLASFCSRLELYSAELEQFHYLCRLDVLFAGLLEHMTVKDSKPSILVILRVGSPYTLAISTRWHSLMQFPRHLLSMFASFQSLINGCLSNVFLVVQR